MIFIRNTKFVYKKNFSFYSGVKGLSPMPYFNEFLKGNNTQKLYIHRKPSKAPSDQVAVYGIALIYYCLQLSPCKIKK